MVRLPDQGDPVAFEPLHQPELPQRPGARQRTGEELPGQVGELTLGAGVWYGGRVDVPVEVEATGVHPHRPAQVEQGRGEPQIVMEPPCIGIDDDSA